LSVVRQGVTLTEDPVPGVTETIHPSAATRLAPIVQLFKIYCDMMSDY